jgi:hypothetical protein
MRSIPTGSCGECGPEEIGRLGEALLVNLGRQLEDATKSNMA